MTTSTTTDNDNNTSTDLTLTTTTVNATVNLNNSTGDDSVTTDGTGSTTVNANNSSGDDTLTINNAGSATVNLNNSTGSDDVDISDMSGAPLATTINLNNSTGKDDNVAIAGTTVAATVNMNSSGVVGYSDDVSITGTNVSATVNLNNSAGDDTISIVGSSSTSATVNLNNSGGNDNITVGSTTGATTATVNLNASGGTDIVNVVGATTTATVNLANSTGQGDVVMLKGQGTGTINASNSTGNDTLIGANTSDSITGGTGNDTVDLEGAGTIYAGSGNDLGIYNLSDHFSLNGGVLQSIHRDVDYYYGQGGTNTLRIVLTPDQANLPAVKADLAAYNAFLASNPSVNQTYTFHFGASSGALTVAGWQTLQIAVVTATISGTAREGQTLTASVTPTGGETGTETYQWQELVGASWVNISGATGSTYILQETDENQYLRVQAVFTDGIGETLTATSVPTSAVIEQADPPSLTVANATTVEDTAVALNITAIAAETDQQAPTVTVTGLGGGTLNHGTNNAGTWTLTQADLTGLTFTPASETDGTVNLTVTATDTETGNSASSAPQTLSVTVNEKADPPSLTVANATTVEDTAVALNITAIAAETDQQAPTVTVTGLGGGTLNHGTNNAGTWTLTQTDLTGLTFTPASETDGTVNLTVTATDTETGNSASSAPQTLSVTVNEKADPPSLTVANATTVEDTAVALNITAIAAETDQQAPTVTVTGLGGGTLNHGTNNAGTWTLTQADLTGLTFTPASEIDGTVNLTVTATDTETGNSASSAPQTLSVTVNEKADPPSLTVANATTVEDTAVALNITAIAAETDQQAPTVTVTGLGGGTLNHGTNNAGTWTLTQADLTGLTFTPASEIDGTVNLTVTATDTETGNSASSAPQTLSVTVNEKADPPSLTVANATTVEDTAVALNITAIAAETDQQAPTVTVTGLGGGTLNHGTNNAGTWTLTQTDLTGLTFTPASETDGTVNLTVTATDTETGNSASSAPQTLSVTVNEKADPPSLTVANATTVEDTAVALNITAIAAETDQQAPTVTVTGLGGGTLNHGTNNAGTWTLTQADLTGLTFTPASETDGTVNLTVTATDTETGNSASSAPQTLSVTVNEKADPPSLTVANATTVEDTAVALNITAIAAETDQQAPTVTVTGLGGGTLNHGTNNAGTWTLTQADLTGLTFTPASETDGTVNLTVTATDTETGNSASSAPQTLSVTVNEKADPPSLTVANATTVEDTAVALNITAIAAETDQQAPTVTVTGLGGGTLNHGTNNAGTWTLTQTDLTGLTFTPASETDGTVNLTVTATDTETGNSASSAPQTLSVTVNEKADPPSLTVANATTVEDTAVALNITAIAAETDQQAPTVTVTGLGGGTLNHGTNNAGTWTLTQADLTGLTFTPASEIDGTVNLTVTATDTETGNSASSAPQTLSVTVNEKADPPSLTVANATTVEDTAVALNITAIAAETDQQAPTVTVTGLGGGTLNHGTNNAGTWTLTQADLTGLTFTPASEIDGTVNLTVTATDTETGNSASSAPQTLSVTVNEKADPPSLTVANATTVEDTAVALNITAIAAETDQQAPTVTVTGLGGGTLNHGTNNAGTWTLTQTDLTGLTFTPASETDGTVNLTVTATDTETGNSASSAPQTLSVTVNEKADPPSLTVANATTVEDTAVALNITAIAAETDQQAPTVTVTGLGGGTLNHGTNNAGTWTLTQADLTGLTFTPASEIDGTVNLTVTATDTETGNSASSAPQTLSVTVNEKADPPSLTVANATTVEDTAVALNITAIAAETDQQAPTVTVTGLGGGTLNHGTNNAGTWTLTQADLTGLTFTPASEIDGTVNLTVTATDTETGNSASSAPQTLSVTVNEKADPPSLTVANATTVEDTAVALNITAIAAETDQQAPTVTVTGLGGGTLNHGTNNAGTWTLTQTDLTGLTFTPASETDGTVNLTVTATDTETGNSASSAPQTLSVTVNEKADPPSLTVANATTVEDTAVALNITAIAAETDQQAPTVTVTGLGGGTLNHGTNNAGTWTLTQADLTGLTFTPASEIDGTVNLTVTATDTETGNSASSAPQTLSVTVNEKADPPSLTVANATTVEDTAVALNITAIAAETDQQAPTVTVTGLGGGTLNHGTNNAGTWTLTQADLTGLTFTPASEIDGTVNLTVTATDTETGNSASSAPQTLSVTVNEKADPPSLTVANATTVEDTAVALNITAIAAETDQQAPTVTVTGLGGGTLNHGTNNAGTWTLTQADLTGLTFTPASEIDGTVNLTVTATDTETGNSASSAPQTLSVTVNEKADPPSLTVANATTVEDTAVALNITAIAAETDQQAPTVTVTGLGGGTLNHGTNNAGTWTLTQADLTGLTFTPASETDGTVNLTVTATDTETGNSASSAPQTLSVTVNEKADPPSLTVANATTVEDTAVALNITAIAAETDQQAPTVTVTGLGGGTLNHGTNNAGTWTLTQTDLTGLTFTPASETDGTVNLTVTATDTETGNSASSAPQTLSVTVNEKADPPSLTVANATTVEDTAVALNITAIAAETDQQAPTVTVTGLGGGTLNHGTNNAGTWTLTQTDLTGLTFTPASETDGTVNLTVTATDTETGNSASSAPQTLSVTVNEKADPPSLTVANATTVEDTAVALNITAIAAETDQQAPTVTVTGLGGGTLNHGTNNAGTWTLTQADLTGLTFTPASEIDGTVNLTVTATDTETGNSASSAPQTLSVTVNEKADPPSLTVANATTVEDTAVALNITAIAAETDQQAPTVTVTGLGGGTLNHGTNNAGTWTLTQADLTGLTFTPASEIDGTVNLTVTATDTETGNSASSAPQTLSVTVNEKADPPSLTVATSASVTEGQPLSLGITATKAETDQNAPTVTISGVTNGTLSAGANNGGGNWTLSQAQLTGLTLTPANDANFTLRLTATDTETGNSATSAGQTIGVTVNPLAPTVAWSLNPFTSIKKNKTTSIGTLAIGANSLTGDTNILTSETVTGSGGSGLAGTALADDAGHSATANGSGTIGSTSVASWDLAHALTLSPPNTTGTFTLTAAATESDANGDTSTNSAILTVSVINPAGIAGHAVNLALADLSADKGDTVATTVSGVPSDWSLNQGMNNGDGSWTVQTGDPAALTVTPAAGFTGAIVVGVTESWTNANGSTGAAIVSDNVEAYAPGSPIFAVSGDDTLTGAGGNDQFVFAQPIGNDTIYNFTASSDTIDLIGFRLAGYGALSIADDAGGNAVVTLGAGETITLKGIDASALSVGNFVFDAEPVSTNSGTMTVDDGAILPLGGTIDNAGTIALGSTGDESDLEILVRGVTLQGGGQVVLSDNSQNVVFGGDGSAVLTNVDNTISGAGQLGAGQLTLVNHGAIDANGNNTLVVDTGSNTVVNTGTLEASGSGGLVVNSAISGGGNAVISGPATLEFAAASDSNVSFAAGATGALKLDQSGSFTGTVSGFAAGESFDLADIGFSAGATLGYAPNAAGTGGTLAVSDGTHTTSLALLGQYAAAGFQAAADQGGGTIITYTPTQTGTTDPTLLTNPQQTA